MDKEKQREKRRLARLKKSQKAKQALLDLEVEMLESDLAEEDELLELQSDEEVSTPVVEEPEAVSDVVNNFTLTINSGAVDLDELTRNSSSLDLDLLELNAIVASDERHTSMFEKFTDWIAKAKLTASAENSLSDEQFALVETVDGKKVRKYPIHDKAHVRNALARAAQMMKEGGQAAADAKKAMPKIHAAAKKMGIGMMNKEKGAVIVEKAADGKYRAVMFPSNNFVDWHGDILSEKAHLDYVDWVNKNMDCAPVFMTWHVPGTARQSPVDFVGYENGFLIMSAPLTDTEAAGLFRAQESTDLGMSHTSIVLERDSKDERVVTKYRTVEVTDLPLDAAANPFTDFDLVMKEADMAIDTKTYLAKILGSDEKAENFLKKVGLKQKELTDAKIPSKEKEVVVEIDVKTPETTPKSESPTIEQVIERVSKEFGMEELSVQFAALAEKAEKVDALEALVAELARDEDEKLAEKIAAPVLKSMSWMSRRPSQQAETVLKENDPEDKKLKESKPSGGWLSEVTGTTPIEA